jgi:hypothetical protein
MRTSMRFGGLWGNKEPLMKDGQYEKFEEIESLYHMCHSRNVASINQNGILSRTAMRNSQQFFKDIADSEIVEKRGRYIDSVHNKSLHEYASLYINPRNSMLYRMGYGENGEFDSRNLDDIVIVEVTGNLIRSPNWAIFSDGNAASQNSKYYKPGDWEGLSKLNRNEIFSSTWEGKEDIKRKMQAEVLVRDKVNPGEIRGFHFRTQEALEKLPPLRCQKSVSPHLFFN